MRIQVSFGKNNKDKNWKNRDIEWNELVDMLRNPRRTSETMAEYDAMSKSERDEVKNGKSIVGGYINGDGRRIKANMSGRQLITLDADNANQQFVEDVNKAFGEYNYVIYQTHSNRPTDVHKYRLFIPLSITVDADAFSAISRKLAELVGMAYFDRTTHDISRLMYLPSCSKDAQYVFIENSGEFLKPERILDMYNNWQDCSEWAKHDDERLDNLIKSGDKARDGRNQRGLIGAFCNAFDVETAIERFLGDIYEKGSQSHRYNYINGTSSNSLEVYPAEQVAFARSNSDVANDGHCKNSYDLVRVHKFKNSKDSVADMNKFCMTINEVIEQLDVNSEQKNESFDEFLRGGSNENWRSWLERDEDGRLLRNARNIQILLRKGEMHGVIGYDEFAGRESWLKSTSFRKLREDIEFEHVQGDDMSLIRNHLATKYNLERMGDTIRDAFKSIARMDIFHPIKQYIESRAWDGKPRAERIFIDYLGVEDSHYSRQITRKILTAAVARLYKPGVKFDECVVIVGEQGIGKSEIIKKLGHKWFCDSLRNFDFKTAGELLQDSWIVELPELSAMKKAEVEEIKAFLSKTNDKYRAAYAENAHSTPRHCIFFGTTNSDAFLKDETGERRFWVLETNKAEIKRNQWEELTIDEIQQLWSEVLVWYKAGESLRLDDSARHVAESLQDKYKQKDERAGVIENWLNIDVRNPDGSVGKRKEVCAMQILSELYGLESRDCKPHVCREVASIMKKMDGWKTGGRKEFVGYGKQTIFIRI